MSRARRSDPFTIGDATVAPGETRRVDLPVARLPTHTEVEVPVMVIHGLLEGPRMWISAAIHGDEINGVEIVRRVTRQLDGRKLRGTVVAVPIVNVFGFLDQSRYLPDRRDLNRSFPGSKQGSLAGRVAHLFMTEIVERCTHGIDFHTGSAHRTNLPQVRADLNDPETLRCAEAFGAPVLIHSRTRDGSLREAASKRGKPVLLYEGGQAQRFEPEPIKAGVLGALRVMAELRMIAKRRRTKPRVVRVTRSSWVRARHAGILRLAVGLGDKVWKGQRIGQIADAFGDQEVDLIASLTGLVIGFQKNPVVHAGDGVVHVAAIADDRDGAD